MERVITFAVLGDSAASGVGDAGPHGVNRGWAYYLTQSFMHPVVYSNLSRPGAQSIEVVEHQLPLALELEPDDYVATFSLAVAHRDLMELNEAIPLFEKAGKINPGQAATINALAVVRGDTCLWGVPDYSDPSFTETAGNIFIKTAKSGPPERQSPIHPLLGAYYLDDPQLLKLVVASHATMAEREAAVYVGRGSIDRCQYLYFVLVKLARLH